MNKTFNDPNTKYSDQGTPLAQAKSVADLVATVEEAVTGLDSTVDELSEKVDLIPVPVVADEGKVLTATDDGAYELADVDALPAISAGDAGKVLTVNAGETAAEWAAPSGGGASITVDSTFATPAINETATGTSIGVGEKQYTVEYCDMSDIPGIIPQDTLSFLPSDISLTFDGHVIAVLKAFTSYPDLMTAFSNDFYTDYAVDNQITVSFTPDQEVPRKVNLVITQGIDGPDTALISLPAITFKKPSDEFIACYNFVFNQQP